MTAKTVKRTWTFQSSSGNGSYETRLYSDGSTSCNCPGWTRRVASDGSRSCKHTREVESAGPKPVASAQPVPAAACVPTPPAFPGVMLAEKYSPRELRAWPAVWCEPKLDGMRILLVKRGHDVRAFARSGKADPYTENLRHILAQLPLTGGDYAVDGELYADEGWGRTMRLAKKANVSDQERQALKVRAFDLLDLTTLDQMRRLPDSMEKRRAALEKLACPSIMPVPYRVFRPGDTAGIDGFYRECLDDGYEGLILKHPHAAYLPGQRSPLWLKMKPVATGDGVIVGFDPGEGQHEGRLGAIRIKFNGTTVAVGCGYTDRQRDWVWAHRTELVGRVLEFAYQNDTVAVARFPRFVRIRWDRECDAGTFPV
jgi:bifunctional non-homologous end joining protein LigD